MVLVKTISAFRVSVVALLDEIKNNPENTVYAVDQDKRAKLTQIRIGETNRAYAAILEGLGQEMWWWSRARKSWQADSRLR